MANRGVAGFESRSDLEKTVGLPYVGAPLDQTNRGGAHGGTPPKVDW